MIISTRGRYALRVLIENLKSIRYWYKFYNSDENGLQPVSQMKLIKKTIKSVPWGYRPSNNDNYYGKNYIGENNFNGTNKMGWRFGFAMMGLISPYPDCYNVYQVLKQTPPQMSHSELR